MRIFALSLAAIGGLIYSTGTMAQSQSGGLVTSPPAEMTNDDEQARNVVTFVRRWQQERSPLSPETYFLSDTRSLLVMDSIMFRVRFASAEGLDGGTPFSELARQTHRLLTEAWEFPLELQPRANPVVGHVDCEVDYQCQCSSEWTYSPISLSSEVPPDSLERLQQNFSEILSVPLGAIYDCYPATVHLDGFREELRCRFLSEVPADAITGDLPPGTISVLAESAVRVRQSDLRPIQGSAREVRPVLAITNNGIVPFMEKWSDPGVRCAIVRVFDRPVFDVSGCRDDVACVDSVLGTFYAVLDARFRDEPLAARVDLTEPALAGERFYVRTYERSHVLGSPFYESSQYILTWYKNEGGSLAPPGVYSFSRGASNHAGNLISLIIRQSLSVRAGRNGPYPEADTRQYAAYEAAVGEAVLFAMEATCDSVGGSINGGFCQVEMN